MKEDVEGVCFYREGEMETKPADHQPSLLLPPFTNIDCAAGLN